MVVMAPHKQQTGRRYPDANRSVEAMDNDLNGDELPRMAADRSAYVRSVEKKLAERRASLELVKRKVHRALAAGHIARTDQIVNAERQANGCLLAVENWITRLSSDPDDDWEDSRFSTDIALEELSQSVKQMVARFT